MINNKKIFAIIQARMKSRRFPGKVMKEILGVPLLKILVERIKNSKFLDGVVVATTKKPEDDIIEEYCQKNNINVFRGHEDDLIERLLFAARAYNVDIIVEQGVDCPLVDVNLISSILEFYFNNKFDYITTLNNKRTIPDGYFARVCPTKLLAEIYNNTRKDIKKGERGLFYIENHPELYKVGVYIPKQESNAYYRLTVDEERDYELVKRIIERFNSINIPMIEVIRFLNKNKDLSVINREITHTENFLYKIGVMGGFINNINVINSEDYQRITDYKFAGFRFTCMCSKENAKQLDLRHYNDYKEMLKKEFIDILVLDENVKDYKKILKVCKDKGISIIRENWNNFQEVCDKIKDLIINKHLK